jgi:hypothetical protein
VFSWIKVWGQVARDREMGQGAAFEGLGNGKFRYREGARSDQDSLDDRPNDRRLKKQVTTQ